VDGIYIDITRQNCRAKMKNDNDGFFTKKTSIFQLVLVFFIVRVNYVLGLIMSIDPHWFSTLFDGTSFKFC
jgi:hypothetical protein